MANLAQTAPNGDGSISTLTTQQPTTADGGNTRLDVVAPDTYNQLPRQPNIAHLAKHPVPNHFMPPIPPTYTHKYSIFLAGSIEMGKAIQWQKLMVEYLSHLPIDICDPRRGDWNTGRDKVKAKADFDVQVKWELAALTKADIICFFFDKATLSPVTMMELGLWAHANKNKEKRVLVCCPDNTDVKAANKKDGFWRGGNVRHVCEDFNIPRAENFLRMVVRIKETIKEMDGGAVTDEDIAASIAEAEKWEQETEHVPFSAQPLNLDERKAVDHEIKGLTEENKRLQYEIQQLKGQLAMLRI